MADDLGFDPFKTATGLLDDEDVTFTACHFGVNPQYVDGDGNPVPLFMTTLVYTDGEREEQFTMGKSLRPAEKGAKAVKEDGSYGPFMKQSQMGKLLDRAIDLNEEAIRGRHEATGLIPQDAGFWEGMQAHVVLEEYSKVLNTTPEQLREKGLTDSIGNRLVLSEVTGWVTTNGSSAKSATKPVKKAPAKKKTAPVVEETVSAVSDEILAQIHAIADSIETDGPAGIDEYTDRCYAEVNGGDVDEAMASVIEDVGPDSIWAASGGTPA